MNYVDSFNLFGVPAKEIPCITGSGAPTTATEGAVGCFYMDTDTGNTYKCTAVADGVYTWVALANLEDGSITPEKTSFVKKEIITGNNLLDKDSVATGQWYQVVDNKPVLKSNEYTGEYGSFCISVDGITNVTISDDLAWARLYNYFFTDDSDNIIKTETFSTAVVFGTNGYTLATPIGATKLHVTVQAYKNMVDYDGNLMVVAGDTAMSYEPYFYEEKLHMPDLVPPTELTDIRVGYDGTVYETAGEAVRMQVAAFGMQKLCDSRKNLIDKNAVTTGGWVAYNTGKFSYYPDNEYVATYCHTDYIPVIGGEKYVYSEYGHSEITYFHSYAYFDKDKVYISGAYPNFSGDYYTFDIPINAAYIVLNDANDERLLGGHPQFEKGEMPTEYEEYLSDADLSAYYLSGLTVKAEQIEDLVLPDVGIELSLPNRYELVVGDTFELFWNGVLKCRYIDCYYIEAVCSKGAPFRKRFVYTPVAGDVGEHTLTISVYDSNHNLLVSGETILSVKNKATSPTNDTVVLYVGDSLTAGGMVPDEFYRRLTANDGTPSGDGLSNISFIGTCTSATNGVCYEGYGGWKFTSYNTENKTAEFMWITVSNHGKTSDDQHSIYADANGVNWKIETVEENRIKVIRVSYPGTLPASGTLTLVSGGVNTENIVYTASEQAAGNPFWNENTGTVDFLNYVQAQGKTSLDYLYILLGWNGINASDEAIVSDAQLFINNVHESFPNCQIVLLGLEMPAPDGLATNYGANASWTYYKAMSHVIRLNRLYAEIAESTENVSFVQVSGQFDTEHNMITAERAVNVRNSAKEVYQSNGVHPAESGYYQIADACYRDFVHKIQQ